MPSISKLKLVELEIKKLFDEKYILDEREQIKCLISLLDPLLMIDIRVLKMVISLRGGKNNGMLKAQLSASEWLLKFCSKKTKLLGKNRE